MANIRAGWEFHNLAELVDDETRGEPGYGLATMSINGVFFHIEIMEVVPCTTCIEDDDGEPVNARHWCDKNLAVSPERQRQLQDIYAAWSGDGPWETIEDKGGRQFVVLILPHCS